MGSVADLKYLDTWSCRLIYLIIGPCTIAVTTLESLQRKGLDPTPEIGLGPFPNSDRASWVTMANYGRGILSHCIDSRRPTAGVYAAGESSHYK